MNGAAALAVLAPTTPDSPPDIIEQIGIGVAEAAVAVYQGLADWESGGRLAEPTRARAGDLFVRLYQLQTEAARGKIDFDNIARSEGKRILWARYGEAMRAQLSFDSATLDAALDTIIDHPLGILRKITAVERALAH